MGIQEGFEKEEGSGKRERKESCAPTEI